MWQGEPETWPRDMCSWQCKRHLCTLEVLAQGLGANAHEGPCDCPKSRCTELSDLDKTEIRMKEMVTRLVTTGDVNLAEDPRSERNMEVIKHGVSNVRKLCQAVELGSSAKINTVLHHLDCLSTVKSDLATELLMLACQYGRLEAVKCLVGEWKADQFCDSAVGGNALTHAAGSGHLHVVKYLVGEEPGSVDFVCDDGFTPLMFAVFWSRLGVMAFLLAKGADVSIEDKCGRTALSYAAMFGTIDTINCLCRADANIYHMDKKKQTPLELAKDYGRCTHVIAALNRWQETERLWVKLKGSSLRTEEQEIVDEIVKADEAKSADQHMIDLLDQIEREEILRKAREGRRNKKKKGGGTLLGKHAGSSRQYENLDSKLESDFSAFTALHIGNVREKVTGRKGDSSNAHERTRSDNSDILKISKGKLHWAKSNPAFLREYWVFIVEEASKCSQPEKQAEYLECLPRLMQECQSCGISVKSGKKVLAKLNRAAADREAITLALSTGKIDKIYSALHNARAVKDSISSELWTLAESVVKGESKPPCEEFLSTCNPDYAKQNNWNTDHDISSTEASLGGNSDTGLKPARQNPNSNPDSSLKDKVDLRGQSSQGITKGDQPPGRDKVGCESAKANRRSMDPIRGEGLNKEAECMICMGAPRSACCIPCGHINMCYGCAKEIESQTGVCPLCRTPIHFVMQIQ